MCVPWVRADTFSLFDKMKFYGTQSRAAQDTHRHRDTYRHTHTDTHTHTHTHRHTRDKKRGREDELGDGRDLDWPKIETERLWISSQDNGLNVPGLGAVSCLLLVLLVLFILAGHSFGASFTPQTGTNKQTNKRTNSGGGDSPRRMFKIIEWKFIRVLFDLGVRRRRKLLFPPPVFPSRSLRQFPAPSPAPSVVVVFFVNNQKFFAFSFYIFWHFVCRCLGGAGKSIYMSLSFPKFPARTGCMYRKEQGEVLGTGDSNRIRALLSLVVLFV